ncbi:hypothetical protein E2C01_096182 [Portunus trituberculatus]|uniref:Uncharacterized protein n=1 Tax=Portunus trituberculatus TaxID=210409 RepID=A0A5B7JUY8_PORTR|nr:hypothetical protein [Portunus trituberculatus]
MVCFSKIEITTKLEVRHPHGFKTSCECSPTAEGLKSGIGRGVAVSHVNAPQSSRGDIHKITTILQLTYVTHPPMTVIKLLCPGMTPVSPVTAIKP